MDATPSPDPEIDCLNAAYGTLGYTITRNGDGSLRAVHPGPPKHASEADTAADFQTALTGGSLASLVANAASVTVQLNADGTGMTALAAESLLSSGLLTGKYVDIQTVTTDITDFEADFGATGSAQHLVTAVPSGDCACTTRW